ncbi:MAG: hypothetical protein NVS3B25_00870 [Hymenobacter sp.]
MKPSFLAFFVLISGLLAGLSPARGGTAARPLAHDTIVVHLPNHAVLTLTVRDAAQLRQLKNYHLDSLTARLAAYIAQAQKAAQSAATEQVTVQFYPNRDQPGKSLPEEIRITTHKKAANTDRVDVVLNKAFGVVVTTDEYGSKSYNTAPRQSKEARQAHRDSVRLQALEHRHTTEHLIFDLGLNAFVNQRPFLGPAGQPEAVELRPDGSRYVNIGLNWDTRLGGKRSPLSLTLGPEFAFNNYMLNGNYRWVNTNGRTDVLPETTGRQLQKTKLASSSINLPLLLQLQLHDGHYKPTLTLGAGGFVGYRLTSWTKVKYTNEGTTYKDKLHDNYNLENFLYGLQGNIGYRSMQFFGKYNLNQLFKTGAGPDTQVLSFGLRLFGN